MSHSYTDSISGYSGDSSRALSYSGLSTHSYPDSSSSPSSFAPARSDDASSDHARSISSHSGLGTMASSTGATSINTTASLYLQAGLLEAHWSRRLTFMLVTSNTFGSMILTVILMNTAVLAIQSTPYVSMNYGWYLSLLDQVFLGIYLMETLSKLFVFRWAYFKNSWNMFDFIIVLTSVVTFALTSLSVSLSSFNPQIVRLFRIFRTLRAIRSLRALRAISFLKSLQIIVEALLSSLPAMSSIIALAGLTLYIFSVIARASYSTYDPRRFGTLGSTFFWLFSTLTLDEWTQIWLDNPDAPGIFLFLFTFMVLETFVFLNLFVAVIVSNLDASRSRMDRLRRRDARAERANAREHIAQAPDADPADPTSLVTFKLTGDPSADHSAADTAHHDDPSATATGTALASRPQVSLHQAIADLLDPPRTSSPSAAASAPPLDDLYSPTDLYYSPAKCIRDKALLGTAFRLLAVLEHEQAHYHVQQGITDELIDLLSMPAVAAASEAKAAVKWRAKPRVASPVESEEDEDGAEEAKGKGSATHVADGIQVRAASALSRRSHGASGEHVGLVKKASSGLGAASSLGAFLSNSLRPSYASISGGGHEHQGRGSGSRPTSASNRASHGHLVPSGHSPRGAGGGGSMGGLSASANASRSSRGGGGSTGLLAQAVATAYLQQQQQQQQQQRRASGERGVEADQGEGDEEGDEEGEEEDGDEEYEEDDEDEDGSQEEDKGAATGGWAGGGGMAAGPGDRHRTGR